MVLCAGLGTRLRPLTWDLGKPLLPVGGEAVAGHTLRALASAGCEMAVLNLHHRPQELPRQFGRSYFGLPLEYSPEAEIQGTGGALYAARSLLRRAEAVVLVNGDTWCRWPVRAVVRHHLRRGADATLMLLPRVPEASLGGGIGVDAEGRVAQLRDLQPSGRPVVRRHVFAGLHVISPAILDRLEEGPSDIISALYQRLLTGGAHLATWIMRRGLWHDLGTPERYHRAALDAIRPRGLRRFLGAIKEKPSHLSPLASIDPSARITTSQVERGASIGRDAEVVSSLVLEGARIADGCRIHHSIVGPGVRLPASSEVEQRMICRHDKRHDLREHESQMGDLVYTPL